MSKVADFMARNNIPPAAEPAVEPVETAVAPVPQPAVTDNWQQEIKAKQAIEELRQSSTNPHVEKMIATILAIVDARIAGNSETAVFGRPDTCNVTTYHKKWKHDPDFAKCLDTLTSLATEWQDTKHVRALQTAAERLQLAAPVAASKLVSLMGSHDQNVSYRAAVAILDRAGVETASKDNQVMQFILNYLDFSKLSLPQIEALQAARNPVDVIEALVQQ